MDIDLLAKMVKEAILDNDTVTLPGVGSFVAELMPSTFSDKGYTIHPPYRRLYFSPRQAGDTLLADMYASARDVSVEDATRVLTDFLAEMKEVLKVRKTVVFPGLGRLRATRENHFFFVADEDLDIYPEGFGLSPVSLKTHEETPEEVAEAVSQLAEVMVDPVTDIEEVQTPAAEDVSVAEPPVVEETPATDEPAVIEDAPIIGEAPVVEEAPAVAEPSPVEEVQAAEAVPAAEETPVVEESVAESPEAPADNPEKAAFTPSPAVRKAYRSDYRHEGFAKSRKRHHRRKVWKVLLVIALILLGLLLAFVLVGHLFPHLLDPLLYSGEELEIVRYKY